TLRSGMHAPEVEGCIHLNERVGTPSRPATLNWMLDAQPPEGEGYVQHCSVERSATAPRRTRGPGTRDAPAPTPRVLYSGLRLHLGDRHPDAGLADSAVAVPSRLDAGSRRSL